MRRLRGRSAVVLKKYAPIKDKKENVVSTSAEALNVVDILTEPLTLPSHFESSPDSDCILGVSAPSLKKSGFRVFDGYELTEEQDVAVDLALYGKDLKVEAFAGAGKTSTLAAISEFLGESSRILYLGFNKSIVVEARSRFPRNVVCRTTHAQALKDLGASWIERLKARKRLSGSFLCEKLIKINPRDWFCGMSGAAFGNLVSATVKRFCSTTDDVVKAAHVPFSVLSKMEDKTLINEAQSHAVIYAQKLFNELINPAGRFGTDHDVYLKFWAMSNPKIDVDVILFDEAQDASPVMLDVITKQKCQKIFVGDRYQQIYSWRGAINAMSTIETDNSCRITQSFRFGQPIADIANDILNNTLNAKVNIRGFDKIKSSVSHINDPETILCRTNASVISELLRNLSYGRRVAVGGGCNEQLRLVEGLRHLKSGKTSDHPDLCTFKTYSELVEYSESDAGTDMASIIKIVDDIGIDSLIDALRSANSVKEDSADLMLSTAHKSKGLEWNTVCLSNDFKHLDSKGYTPEESNLLYVAATRAKNILDIETCEAVQKAISG